MNFSESKSNLQQYTAAVQQMHQQAAVMIGSLEALGGQIVGIETNFAPFIEALAAQAAAPDAPAVITGLKSEVELLSAEHQQSKAIVAAIRKVLIDAGLISE